MSNGGVQSQWRMQELMLGGLRVWAASGVAGGMTPAGGLRSESSQKLKT